MFNPFKGREERKTISVAGKGDWLMIKNECGTFIVDGDGILQEFHPSSFNPIFEEEFTIRANYEYTCPRAIRKLIIPEGIRGFMDGAFSGLRVVDVLLLPETLEEIGDDSYDPNDNKRMCVFANCILPKVVIPEGVKKVGAFAFGHCYIDELVLPRSIRSQYARQFKDGHIRRLHLPLELKDCFHKGNDMEMGWLCWYSTKVDETVYY